MSIRSSFGWFVLRSGACSGGLPGSTQKYQEVEAGFVDLLSDAPEKAAEATPLPAEQPQAEAGASVCSQAPLNLQILALWCYCPDQLVTAPFPFSNDRAYPIPIRVTAHRKSAPFMDQVRLEVRSPFRKSFRNSYFLA